MKKENKWIWVLIPALIMTGCGLADKAKDKATNPSAGGTGAVAVSSAIAGVTFVNSIVSGITTAAKPSTGGLNAGIIASAFNLPTTYNCSGGGQINFSGITGTAVNCVENGGTITANVTITVVPLTLTTCNLKDLPASLSATLNGPIKIGSADFTLTSLGMAFSGITYDATCKMASFSAAVTGAIGNSAIPTTVDFGTGGVLFDVTINRSVTPNQAEISIPSGSVTVHTPCLDGSFTMATTSTIIIPDGATCPTSGSVTISGGLSGVVNYPADCTNPFCVLGL